MRLWTLWELLKTAGLRWWQHQAMRLGAAVAFYSMLSLAPLVVIVMALAGFVFGPEAARGELVGQMRELVGEEGGRVIQQLLASAAERPAAGALSAVLGGMMLLVGAVGVFAELQDGLNIVWGVAQKPSAGWWALIRARLLSFSMVFGVAFLLIVSLVVSTALAALGRYAGGLESALAPLLHLLHLVLSVALVGLLFALLLKFLPSAPVPWHAALVGGLFTAALFGVGKYLIGLYIGTSGFGTAYGAAGSFAIFFVWMYYSAQIFFFGAEFTRAYAERLRPQEAANQEREDRREHELTRV